MPILQNDSKPLARSLLALVIPIASAACGTTMHKESPPPEPLRLLAAGATEAAVRDRIAAFETKNGFSVELGFGAVGALGDQVLAGSPADVVIVTPAIITRLEAQSAVRAGSRVDLGRIGGGLAVRSGTQPPAIATVEQFKQALLDADELHYADPAKATAGAAFMKIVDTLGIGDQVRAKGHIASGGKEAVQNMTHSTAARAIGVTQISEILSVPEATLVGEYPATLQVKTTYSAVILERSERVDDAQKLVQFFAAPEFQARLAMSGFEPVPAERH